LILLIGDVRDSNAIESVFEKYQFDIVYHLAALKHVPVCEYQPVEAIKTNVNGTINMIKASTKYKVKTIKEMSDEYFEIFKKYYEFNKESGK